MGVSHLNKAFRKKNDEFYTPLEYIENELKHHTSHFEGKVIYCNCDDPRMSKFFVYFFLNFKRLKLKRIIFSFYIQEKYDLFHPKSEKPFCLIYDGEEIDNYRDMGNFKTYPLESDGDFRNPECIELLKKSDIIVTNPPFSLFLPHFNQLIEYDKKFLIIANSISFCYKDVFKVFKKNKIWLGKTSINYDVLFDIPQDKWGDIITNKKNGTGYKIIDGVIKAAAKVVWWTNLGDVRKYRDLVLDKSYNSKDYPSYDNFNAIEVGKTKDIPKDYYGAMGVPLTFLEKYNPTQFKILGYDNDRNRGASKELGHDRGENCIVNGKTKFRRVFIKRIPQTQSN